MIGSLTVAGEAKQPRILIKKEKPWTAWLFAL